MKIRRFIGVYEKTGEKFIKEINADAIEMDLIKKLFVSYDDDLNFYDPYKVEQIQYNELVNHIKELKSYPYMKYDFYLEAVTFQMCQQNYSPEVCAPTDWSNGVVVNIRYDSKVVKHEQAVARDLNDRKAFEQESTIADAIWVISQLVAGDEINGAIDANFGYK